jgi:hypothetical protein
VGEDIAAALRRIGFIGKLGPPSLSPDDHFRIDELVDDIINRPDTDPGGFADVRRGYARLP